jgi:hypothetical protein
MGNIATRTFAQGRDARLKRTTQQIAAVWVNSWVRGHILSQLSGWISAQVHDSVHGPTATSGGERVTSASDGKAARGKHRLRSESVRVFGCRPVMMALETPGPASENLQWRKSREGIRWLCSAHYGELKGAAEFGTK